MATTLRSFAKINLGLGIGPVREDGYHELLTVYQTVAIHDLVTVSARRLPSGAARSRLSLSSNNARVPTDARNTAWRMVAGALDRMDVRAEVHVHIEKRLPIQGGMGAGSANAAAALIGLERELGEALREEERLAVAAQVGSDVPLFLIGGTVLGTGRGEIVEAVQDLPPTACVIAVPEIGVSTPRAFQAWDEMQAGLTSIGERGSLNMLSHAYEVLRNGTQAGTADWLSSDIVNDFEAVIFQQHTELSRVKRTVVGEQACEASFHAELSGSGSAIFGLYRTREAAESACQRLGRIDIRSILTETLPRQGYWARMIAETADRL